MKLAICGLMRAGKDTAALHLQSKYGGKILKFADPLYEMQAEIFRIMDRPLPESGKHRQLLQFLGTDFGRSIDANLWVGLFEKRLSACEDENIFVTDCRFPNEYDCLRKHGFKMVFIEADDCIRQKRGASHGSHESERFMANVPSTSFDVLIHNNAELGVFLKALDFYF